MKNAASPNLNRRRFLQSTSTGVALFNILPGRLLNGAEAPAPNGKVNLAGIGIGSRGGADVGELAELGHNIVALCDVDENYAAKEFAKYPDAKRFVDYRVMLDKMGGEIDGVIIGTPDHTHAIIAMEAMRRGKHVYCEKPLAHSVQEVRDLMAAAREHKVVTQLGNQGHSSGSIRRVCEWIWAGALGNVHTVHAGCDAFKEVVSRLQTPVSSSYDPLAVVKETNCNAAGIKSRTCTPVASFGPALETVSVKMTLSPTSGVALSTLLISDKSI
jgi:hypothetical protein